MDQHGPGAATVAGWTAANQLWDHLEREGTPERLTASGFITDRPVYLDTGYHYARYHPANPLTGAPAGWHEQQTVRTVMTDQTTWCLVSGRWLWFHHHGVMSYELTGQTSTLAFNDADPVALTGPGAWTHAVLFAYLRIGPTRWMGAEWLQEMRDGRRSALGGAVHGGPAPSSGAPAPGAPRSSRPGPGV